MNPQNVFFGHHITLSMKSYEGHNMIHMHLRAHNSSITSDYIWAKLTKTLTIFDY